MHDFGFLRFDVRKLKFLEPTEVPLKPEAAQVGLDIRVVGNDSGEKLSILSGTIARLDRDAPHYSKSGYNDFNTFYLQAASGTKGGSSGSPVIDCKGNAIGLNAGSKTKSSAAFFLPLHRVVRALRLLQDSLEPITDSGLLAPPIESFSIPRGTIQTTFVYKGFDEARRLGLSQEIEAEVRKVNACASNGGGATSGSFHGGGETGMLIVEGVVPKGQAFEKLQPGDVLFKLNGKITTRFLDVEALLDDSIGGQVAATVVRGGELLDVELQVGDLHAITPDSFLQVAGGVVHALSYQQARNFLGECGLVYVSDPGFVLGRACVPRHAIITSLNGVATPSIREFCVVLESLKHGQRVPLEYFIFQERHRSETVVMQHDTKWYGSPRFWTRNDSTGLWDACSIREKFGDEELDGGAKEEAPGSAGAGDAKMADAETDAGAGKEAADGGTAAVDGAAENGAPVRAGERIMEGVVPSLVVITRCGAGVPTAGVEQQGDAGKG